MKTRCGYIALVGRPNVGKSTLLNNILGEKLSITTNKPQTTRHQILGIKTEGDTQAIYVDTPGLHLQGKRGLNKRMNKTALQAAIDVDVIVFVVQALQWTADDEWALNHLKNLKQPIILAVNKIDLVKEKELLLPYLKTLSEKHDFAEIVPVSATRGAQVEQLERQIDSYLPKTVFFYASDELTNRSERFLAAEIVREKLMRSLSQELPYSITVEIESFKQEENLLRLAAVIWVEKNSQKAIVIGKGGSNLKKIGKEARFALEKFFDIKVFLQMWVKVKGGWADDDRALDYIFEEK